MHVHEKKLEVNIYYIKRIRVISKKLLSKFFGNVYIFVTQDAWSSVGTFGRSTNESVNNTTSL